jgi:CubicO group peptidase (beta-lactamase class C family)
MAGYVARGVVPGVVTLLARRGEVVVDARGAQAIGGAPMQRATIFRVASMVKPITAVAAMILVEECRLRLDDPVDTFLPELAHRRVLRSIASPLDDTVPASRAITLRDLLTLRLGVGSVLAAPGTYPIQHAISELRIGGDGPPQPTTTPPPDAWMRNLGSLPLMEQPGERWLYNVSADVLGVLIARASAQSFGDFLHERIFAPLGMRDTGFFVPADKLHRVATSYEADGETGPLTLYDAAEGGQWTAPPPFEFGAGGLVSTANDYLAFCHMLLGKAKLGTQRILARPTVEAMTSDQLTPAQRIGAEMFFHNNSSWGFGMAVSTKRTDGWAVPGRFGWDGGGLCDTYGMRRATVLPLLLGVPAGLLCLWAPTPATAFGASALTGVCVGGQHSVLVVHAQRLLPTGKSFASGLILGFTFASGGVGTWLGGIAADSVGLLMVMQIVTLLGLPCALLAMTLPGRAQQEHVTAPAEAAPVQP